MRHLEQLLVGVILSNRLKTPQRTRTYTPVAVDARGQIKPVGCAQALMQCKARNRVKLPQGNWVRPILVSFYFTCYFT